MDKLRKWHLYRSHEQELAQCLCNILSLILQGSNHMLPRLPKSGDTYQGISLDQVAVDLSAKI